MESTPSARVCSIDGCEKPYCARGWCNTHYSRWRKTGDTGSVETTPPKNRKCAVDGCGRPYSSNNYCQMHNSRWKAHGDPGPAGLLVIRGQTTCSVDGCEEPYRCNGFCIKHEARWSRYGDPLITHNNKYDVIQYHAAHDKVRDAKGWPSQYPCEHCGKPAEEWSYKGNAPDELMGPSGPGGKPRRYSLNVEYYQPLCIPCHRRFDKKNPDQCTIDGCDSPCRALGLCYKHWKRQHKAKLKKG